MVAPLKLGLAGLGTVGVGVLIELIENQALISERAGRDLIVHGVSAREKNKDRGVSLKNIKWYENPSDLCVDPEIDIVIELIGGADGVALSIAKSAILNEKHFITANKALMAHHGPALAAASEIKNVSVAFEAAVAGGIPIIKVLREGLAGNDVSSIFGILNGTSNYILSSMADTKREFDEVLAEAQKLGYAESDPSFDVDGIDAAHKLSIIASIAFSTIVDFRDVYVEGIRYISPIDISFAKTLGYGIKLLAVANRIDGHAELRVHPCMIPLNSPINHVSGVLNGIVVHGHNTGSTIYEGAGAGQGPTTSAVISDLIDIARQNFVPAFGVRSEKLNTLSVASIENRIGAYYIRLMVVDQPGVFAEVANSLKNHDVSMESVLQQSRHPGEPVPVVMTVHNTPEYAMKNCLEDLKRVDEIVDPPMMIRIETFV